MKHRMTPLSYRAQPVRLNNVIYLNIEIQSGLDCQGVYARQTRMNASSRASRDYASSTMALLPTYSKALEHSHLSLGGTAHDV